ncbi:DUF3383 domain-containing protein [Candidatus Parcubacteria bacterium]|nr:DUF3383 domain-containing protein [Candidatus Parcubacteria bacterium]
MKLARTFRAPQSPLYASAYLLCGGSPTTVVATWNAVTNGAFQVTIDGTARSITGIDFSAATTMAEIAALIQTALRAVTSGSEVVIYDSTSTRFVIISGITTSSSAITKLTAGASGTDISGAGAGAFMDGDVGATGEVVVNASLGYQTLTNSFATLGEQFAIAHAGQLSIKFVHKAQASTQQVTAYLEVSDDSIGTAEASSNWHPIGVQDASGGATSVLTEEEYQYQLNVATDTADNFATPLRYTDVAQKARIRVKANVSAGFIKASVGLVEH